jgi:hypothetical protein
MYRYYHLLLILAVVFVFTSCNKKEGNTDQTGSNNGEFIWKENLSVKDIPNSPIKGMIDGKNINITYVNFEKWRGSNDNVLNFSDKAPLNKCGFIENDNAFHLTRVGGDIKEGDLNKDTFLKNLEGYVADFHVTENEDMKKISTGWNLALVIDEINDDVVKGKIAMCFKDDKKSWIAGKFEAVRCNN